mgnify:CR=1 FL=1
MQKELFQDLPKLVGLRVTKSKDSPFYLVERYCHPFGWVKAAEVLFKKDIAPVFPCRIDWRVLS